MRKIFLAFVLFVAILSCGCIISKDGGKKLEGSQLMSYKYVISNGYSGIKDEYEISMVDSVVVARVNFCNFLLDTCTEYVAGDVPREKLVEIGNLLVNAKVQNWESSYTNPYVMDGDSWSVSIKFSEASIWSGGYMEWPDDNPMFEILGIIRGLCVPKDDN